MTFDLEPGVPCLFVSPHLDDAILSCGALITRLARTNPVVVATLFTTCSGPPHTLSGRTFLRACAQPDAVSLFAERRREDAAVVSDAGATHVHLGFPDALFRLRGGGADLRGRRRRRHVYPTHRLHIGRGRVSPLDAPLIEQAADAVDAVAREIGAGCAFFPLAVGRHVDHVITRTVGSGYRRAKVFYADFPYVLDHRPDQAFLDDHRLAEELCGEGLERKAELISGYRTQVDALFPRGEIPVVAERFYAAEPQRAAAGGVG
jgi:LmbE family N-acetylglucosaminyl deacetylase